MNIPKSKDLSTRAISLFCSRFNGQVVVKATTPSTQLLARHYVKNQRPNKSIAFFADQQTAAYGKGGRPFYAPKNTGLYFSLVLPPRLSPQLANIGLFTTGVAVAIRRALHTFYPYHDFRLKWVNDLYIEQQKVAGILNELIFCPALDQSCCVLGIGINLTTTTFPTKLQSVARAIDPNGSVDRNRLAAALLDQLTYTIFHYQDGRLLTDYRAHSLLIGHCVRVIMNHTVILGTVITIDDHARLVIEDDQHRFHHLASGDVTKIIF